MDATITKVPVIALTKGSQHYEISPFVEGSTGIASGTLNLQTSIVTEELDFGNLTASELSLEIYNIYFDLQGFNIQLILEDSTTHDRTTLFTGIVDSSKEDTFGASRQVVAYDWAYYHRGDNVASWWNDFWHGVNTRANATLKEIRDSLMQYMGFNASTETYLNDSIVIPNNFELATTLDFETALKFVCELQATFPHIDANGNMEFISLSSTSTDIRGTYEGSNSSWEDYTTDVITGIGIYSTSDDLAQVVGTDANVYNIAGNLLALTLDASTITTMCNNILQALATVQFVPCEINMIMSDFDLSLGQKIETEKGYSYVMQNVYHGICMVDEMISCKALGKKLSQDVASYNNTMMNGAKVSKIEKDIDGIVSTVSEAVVEAHEAAEDANEALEQVGQYDTRISTVESSITQHANEIVMKVDNNGRIVQAALTTDPDDGTEFKVSADNIEFIANGVMNLTANQLGISSTNFSINKDTGAVEVQGTITATSIKVYDKIIGHNTQSDTEFTLIDYTSYQQQFDNVGIEFKNALDETYLHYDPFRNDDTSPHLKTGCGLDVLTWLNVGTTGSTTSTQNGKIYCTSDINCGRYVYATYFNQSSGAQNPASYTSYVPFFSSDGFLRKSSLANFKTWFGAATSATKATYATLNYLGNTTSSTAKNFTINANCTEIVITGAFTGDNINKLFTASIPKNLLGTTAKEIWLSGGTGTTSSSNARCLCNVTLVNSTTITVKGTSSNNGSTNTLSGTTYYVYQR